MAKGWLKRPEGRNATLFVWRDSMRKPKSRTLGPATMSDEEAWAKAGEEGYTLLPGKPSVDHVLFGQLRRAGWRTGTQPVVAPKLTAP